jgi:aryl-alcohol dehydrogenase-like predicted oxidoreductase
LEYPGLASAQIIYTIFRQRPAELFFDMPKRRDVAVILRVPLASGMLRPSPASLTRKGLRRWKRSARWFRPA